MTTNLPSPAMDDSPTVPRPPGAVEAVAAVLAEHVVISGIRDMQTHCKCGWASGGRAGAPHHRRHQAQALVDAGCVLGDDWVVETAEELETRDESGMGLAVPTGRTRTVTTATRTTTWKASDE